MFINNRQIKTSPRLKLVILLFASLATTFCSGEEPVNPDTYTALHRAIVKYETESGEAAPSYKDYTVSLVNLDKEGAEEAVVVFRAPNYCGSGGCSARILKQWENGSFSVVSSHTLFRTGKVWVSSSDFWDDLVVEVSGGGAQRQKHLLSHNGNSYPLNPSVQAVYSGPDQKLVPLVFREMPVIETDLR